MAGACGHEGCEAPDERPATARREDGATPEKSEVIAPEGDAPGDVGEKTTHEVVFRGPRQEGLRNEAIRYVHGILVRTFGGMYISSNKAEVLFEVKAPLKAHRTVRNGTRMILIVLHTWSSLRKLPREEIEAFLREAISLERLGRLMIKRDHRGRVQRDKHREVEAILSQAMEAREPVIIAYKDRRGRHTGRMIQPLAFKKNDYTGQTMIEAFCYLRDEERTFMVDRISDAMLDEPLLGIIS